MLNKEQLDEIKQLHEMSEEYPEHKDVIDVELLRKGVPALIAEVERLQKANRERAEIIEEQNKELNKFRMDKSLMDFGISTERVRVVEKEKIPNQAFRNRKRQVKHLTRGCIRRNAEIRRLREALEFYANEENWERTYQDSDIVAQGQLVEYWEPSPIEFDDKGKTARKALEGDNECS